MENRKNVGVDKVEYLGKEPSAPYAMKSNLSRGRKYSESSHPYRGIYQRDRDRIVHSSAFRRLEYKTQVFVNHEGDHYRTRLTHTLEVAQIARSIARAMKLNEDLVEAISLAHDLGHTPFGHSGEETLCLLMKDHGGFEHNLQGLRVVDYLEERYPDFKGLNLTYEVREGILKHNTCFDLAGKTIFLNEPGKRETNKKITYTLPQSYAGISLKELRPGLPSFLEAQVVDMADEIAYDNHDLDDGINSKLLSEEELRRFELWDMSTGIVEKKYPGLKLKDKMRRMQVIRTIIDLQVTDILDNSSLKIKKLGIKSIEDVSKVYGRIVSFSNKMDNMRKPLRKYLIDNLYHHYRVIRMADKARRFIEELFNVYIKRPEQLPFTSKSRLSQEDYYRVVCDYIAGMTDRYALEEYKKLFEPFERV
jgi:dGTPase